MEVSHVIIQKPKPGKLRSLQLAFWMMLKTAKRNRCEWPLIWVCGGVHWKGHSLSIHIHVWISIACHLDVLSFI